ncbi:DUF7340 domain-containing protein [Pseudonocardia broussonetiae]|uniref:Uncharacterized protein n=1 Tax=Pseudonocardia broussonetiae TaxID=2736640 RepID=A0A6M6JFA6_9PSEU|nr:hypothetical protein [Pseudonocardia broussonetiae]QJY46668.1 hypothetical protein HOP40_13265 [Pseudonocardia broussonetiae]
MTEPEQAAPVDVDAAHLALDAAITQLVQPSTEKVDRADGLIDSQVAQQRAEERATTAELQRRLAGHRAAGQQMQAHLVMRQLRDHRRRVVKRRTNGRATTAVVPSLLVQLRSEIGASSNTGAGGSAGPYRSIIAIPATELHAEIQRTTHAPRGALDLRPHVTRWAATTTDLVHAATKASAWVEQIRTLLNPPKRWHHPGACPDCGQATAHVVDTSGDLVRRPAIEFDRDRGRARCLRCPAHWDTEAQLHQLARVLVEQQHDLRIS